MILWINLWITEVFLQDFLNWTFDKFLEEYFKKISERSFDFLGIRTRIPRVIYKWMSLRISNDIAGRISDKKIPGTYLLLGGISDGIPWSSLNNKSFIVGFLFRRSKSQYHK